MILYIIRFSLSLAMFYGFYKLLLEKEKTFVFNRFFLLLGLVFSLVVPLISFSGPEEFKMLLSDTGLNVSQQMITWNQLFDVVYLGVTFIFLVRFGIDTTKLWRRIKKGKIEWINDTKVVLTNKSHAPYSFMNYVFISEQNFAHIEPELIDHEIAHVRQGHTYDILLIEFVKAFIWINPMLGLFKKSMRLNHEFLADQSAINNTTSISHYQNMLLGYFMSQDVPAIASGFNFSLTKKRFLMMKKRKSKTQYLKQLMALPLIAFILWSCSDNQGVTGKEMLKYWRYTANMEEILRTGQMNEKDLEEGIILPIENKAEYDALQDIYNRMNSNQKKSVYELPPYLEPIEDSSN
ncbi:M56 family metallopeptidase [Marinoscillum sp.]|uniref:M56 family metallopeptidase n=1 Tax=Marinoscillum sp. TaxID=2024838 RepID=UPI003BADA4D8